MTVLPTTPAAFAALRLRAVAGDVLSLSAGSYGDVTFKGLRYATPLRIVAADPLNPPVFRSLNINDTQGLRFENVSVAYTPNATTIDGSAVVYIYKSRDIGFTGGSIRGGAAVNGVPATALRLDASGNVLGYPTPTGVVMAFSASTPNQDITIEGVEILDLFRGITLSGDRITIRGNHIHDLRKSGILGGGNDLLIEDNRLHSAKPWRYGETPYGDHGDWIAIWNGNVDRKDPVTGAVIRAQVQRGVIIKANLMRTGAGVPMMGGWIQGKGPGIEDVVYEQNTVFGGDAVGFSLSDVRRALIADNISIQDDPDGKPIGIIVSDGTSDVVARGNRVGSVADKMGGATGNVLHDNSPAPAWVAELVTRLAN